MNIVFLMTQSLESPGGAGRYLPLAKSLARNGHAVKIIALHHNFRELKERQFHLDGVEVQYVGQMQVRKQGNSKTYFSTPYLLWVVALATLRLTAAVLSANADIVQICKAQPMNIVAAWVKHLLHRAPVFLDSDDYETLNNRFRYGWQQKITSWFEYAVSRFCTRIIVSNTFLFNLYQSYGYPEERIHIIPHGFDPERFKITDEAAISQQALNLKKELQISPEQKVVVFVGSISLITHAIDLLLQAFKIVKQARENTVLVIVGGGEDFEKVHEEAAELGIEKSVRFTGKVERDLVPMYYRLGDVSVDPKYKGLLPSSTLSIKIFESIAAETPCVSADIGDSAQILSDAGIMVEPGSAEALAAGILTALNDEDCSKNMRAAARRLKQKYSWDHHAVQMVQLYRASIK